MAAYKIAAVKEDVRERGFRRGDRGFGRVGSSDIGGRAWIPMTRSQIRDKAGVAHKIAADAISGAKDVDSEEWLDADSKECLFRKRNR